MKLKTSYSAREVAALTGLTARQLQGWDASRVFPSAISPRRTNAGGFPERRYSPVDLVELVVLADLRRRGFTPADLKQLIDTLRAYFRRRLSETLDDAGETAEGCFSARERDTCSTCSWTRRSRS